MAKVVHTTPEPRWVLLAALLKRVPQEALEEARRVLVEDFILGKRQYRCIEAKNICWTFKGEMHSLVAAGTFTKLPEDAWRFGTIAWGLSTLAFANRLYAQIEILIGTQQPTIEPFRTGGAGRPTAKVLIVAEFKRRIETGEVTPYRHGGLKEESECLFHWWEKERQTHTPLGPEVKVGTIENRIRTSWRALAAKSKPTK